MIRVGINSHLGERCFVIGSGPSLKGMDLSWLANETTICVNESYKALPFEPSFVAIGDYKLWPFVKDHYATMSSKVLVVEGLNGTTGSEYPGTNMKMRVPLSKTSILNSGFHWNLHNNPVNRGYNVVPEVVLPFVCWAGFSECYLIGCDCTENGYAFEDSARGREHQLIDERIFKTYEIIRDTPLLPTKIYNATVGGRLEVFPRRDFSLIPKEDEIMDNLLVVGYYTPDRDYKQLATSMKRSVERFGLPCIIQKRPSLAQHHEAQESLPKPMPWVLNCSLCARFIFDVMKLYPQSNLLYLDADATMARAPMDLYDVVGSADFAAPFLTNDFVQNELVSNTLYFKNSDRAKDLVKRWMVEQEKQNQLMLCGTYREPYKEAWDQVTLQRTLESMGWIESNEGPDDHGRWTRLPWTYGKMDPTSKGVELMPGVRTSDVCIAQHQSSRWNKRFV